MRTAVTAEMVAAVEEMAESNHNFPYDQNTLCLKN